MAGNKLYVYMVVLMQRLSLTGVHPSGWKRIDALYERMI